MKIFFLYSRATKGGGALIKSTSSGGGSTQTSSSGGGTTATSTSGGGVSTSTQSGGGSAQTSSGGGEHDHVVFKWNSEVPVGSPNLRGYKSRLWATGDQVDVNIEGPTADIKTYTSSGNHTHNVSIPSHSHNFSTPNHSHNVTIPNHTHNVTIPGHSHEINLPDHTHEIEYGIFKLPQKPTAVTIKVDGKAVPYTATSGDNIDLVPYLAVDSSGKVRRGQWHTVEITPNDLGRVTAQITTQFFVQSRGEGDH